MLVLIQAYSMFSFGPRRKCMKKSIKMHNTKSRHLIRENYIQMHFLSIRYTLSFHTDQTQERNEKKSILWVQRFSYGVQTA